jgi:hypothetical protein
MKPIEQRKRWNQVAINHIQGCFQPQDHLAVLIVNKKARSVVQRLASAHVIATGEFQEWLRVKNAAGYDVYLSANALKPDATGRTKSDVGTIRHVFLDFDENGTAAVQQLFKRKDLPVPSLVVNTSPDKWQVLWQVEAFGKDEAESLQRMLARQTGADRAATDCARVLRFPGFYNHKYGEPYLVRLEPHAALSGIVYRPERFPKILIEDRVALSGAAQSGSRTAHRNMRGLSQSERDWAYAKRALARGDPREVVIAAIATHRRYDKYNPSYYAELTVKKVADQLDAEKARDGGPER